MRNLWLIALLSTALLGACGKKADKPEQASKAAEPAEPAKAEPTKAEPTKAEPTKAEPAKPEPAKPEPAKPEPGEVSTADQELVTSLPSKTSFEFTSPTGEKVKIEAKTKLVKGTYVTEMIVGGK